MFVILIGISVVTMVISLAAAARVKSVYRKHSRYAVSSGASGAEVAYRILSAAGIDDVQIVEHQSFLGDHYDPVRKRLVLSSENFHGQSPAALGVAAHECGHAIQHKIAYAPLKWRMASVGVTTYANQIVTWLPLIGLFLGLFTPSTYFGLMAAGWAVIMLFNLVTLPVEFDASRRAVVILNKMRFLQSEEETDAVSQVLRAAGWTYVAAFITSLLYMLYYILPFFFGNRD